MCKCGVCVKVKEENNPQICEGCGIFVKNMGRHLKRDRCKEQHIRLRWKMKQY